jgi:hypothetical protein
MSYGGWYHNKMQFGRESTAGTAVAATEIWRGAFGGLTDDRRIEVVDENVGILFTSERSYTAAYLGRCNMPATPLTFEQYPHILEAGIMTATPTGTAAPYTYTYTMATGNTVNTIKTYTLEMVNSVVAGDYREMPYCFVEEFTVSGDAGGPLTVAANWVGRQLNTGTATSLSTLLTVEEALLARTKLYIDASGGTVGTTQESGVLMGLELRCRTGIVPVPVGDGSLYFAAHKFTRPEVTVSLTLELEDSAGTVAAERAAYEAQTVRLVRLDTDGSSASRNIYHDMAVKWDSVSDYQNADGNTTVTFDGHVVYSSADDLAFEVAVTNTRANLAS